jgi:hypothetical protein
MKIHGVRIYPQSTEVVRGYGAPIYVHGRVSEECSDFYYTFGPLASLWQNHFFVKDFVGSYDEKGKLEDPLPGLREEYGGSLIAADVENQLMVLRGDDFESWGAPMYFCEGAFLPIFKEQPAFDMVKRLYWGRDFRLTADTWPSQMRAVMHMWDDIYWQLFTTEPTDLKMLLEAHAGDQKLRMFFVDFDREFPDPSNQKLQPASAADI